MKEQTRSSLRFLPCVRRGASFTNFSVQHPRTKTILLLLLLLRDPNVPVFGGGGVRNAVASSLFPCWEDRAIPLSHVCVTAFKVVVSPFVCGARHAASWICDCDVPSCGRSHASILLLIL